MSAPLFDRSRTQVIKSDGRKASGALIYFFDAGTSTPRTTYSDSALATPQAHPVVADANGLIPAIYLQYGDYRVRVETSTGVVISDDDNVALPTPPESGGGGGVVVSADEIVQTGDIIIATTTAARSGFVMLNGGTIGNAASGATERANADTADLYAYNWNNHADFYCPVSGGRGANPAADFAANKTIQLLSAQGRALFGADTMGGTAANIAQASSTVSTTNLSTSATVADISGIYVGMQIVSANIPAGTSVTAISGSTITMSAQATLTASGTAARFSTFRDAQVPGAAGGLHRHTLNQGELSIALGTATTVLNNATTVLRGGNGVDAGTGFTAATVISDITASTTITNPVGDKPHNNMPPGLVVTFYQKL